MGKRKSLSNKIRFEVFKRDKFTCQYCGKKSPDVILEVDHIEPVSKGGSNDIVNLITSCWTCNSGKSNIKLDDNTAVEKQRKQLEILQEKREQMKMMIEWKKGLENFHSEAVELIEDYWSSKIDGYGLNDSGRQTLQKLYNKFEFDEILEAIDTAIEKYLKYDGVSGEPTKESVENAFSKVGGILHLKSMPPIKQKFSYIKGIGRNRYNYFNNRTASIILESYVKALTNQGWSEEKILEDLENEVIPETINAKNWTAWKNLIEGWINSINNWETATEDSESEDLEFEYEILEDVSEKEVDEYLKRISQQIRAVYSILDDLKDVFENEDATSFKKDFYSSVLKYFDLIIEEYESDWWLSEIDRDKYSVIFKELNYFQHLPVDSWKSYFINDMLYGFFKDFYSEVSVVGDDSKFPIDSYKHIREQLKNIDKS